MTRFYLQQKEDPHGPSISLYVGNLPTGLSQRQYEKILLDIIGRGVLSTTVCSPIYFLPACFPTCLHCLSSHLLHLSYLSICLSVIYLYTCLSYIYLQISVYMYVCCLYVSLSIYLLYIYPPTCLSISQSVLSVCLPITL